VRKGREMTMGQQMKKLKGKRRQGEIRWDPWFEKRRRNNCQHIQELVKTTWEIIGGGKA
jgi:hypothetical protein